MARYKHIDTNPKLLPVDLARQLLPGTFEHALNHLLDGPIDLSSFDARFRNDETGAPAYPPALLLKVVLFAYSQGIVSSRGIEQACREHVTFIALCGDMAPHFTTIAHFVSTVGADIARVFAAVVAICDAQGLIGREMFAIDGVKLPSNASKRRSGTRADFERQATKLEAVAATMLQRHREADATPTEPTLAVKAAKRIERLERDAAQIREWLAANPDERRGVKGAIRKSNRTDNESAKMATGKGVIQGYTGVAAVDDTHQIIVEAQAHGTGSEQELLLPVVTAMKPMLSAQSLITADAGYHSEANLQQLAAMPVAALIADNEMRRRDERFTTQDRHQDAPDPLHDKSEPDAEEPDGLSGQRLHLRCRGAHVRLPGREVAESGRPAITSIGTTSGSGFRARNATASRARCGRCASAHRRRRRCARHVLPGQDGALARDAHRPNETADRLTGRSDAVRPTFRDGGARVWQSMLQQGTHPVHAAWSNEGRRAVEALLPGPQYREAGPLRLCAVNERRTPVALGTAVEHHAASANSDRAARRPPTTTRPFHLA